jgi:hypothetical protein
MRNDNKKSSSINFWVNPKYEKEIFFTDVLCLEADFEEFVAVESKGKVLEKYKAIFTNTYFYNMHMHIAKYEFISYKGPFETLDILFNLN